MVGVGIAGGTFGAAAGVLSGAVDEGGVRLKEECLVRARGGQLSLI